MGTDETSVGDEGVGGVLGLRGSIEVEFDCV